MGRRSYQFSLSHLVFFSSPLYSAHDALFNINTAHNRTEKKYTHNTPHSHHHLPPTTTTATTTYPTDFVRITMQKDPIHPTNHILGAGAKAGAVDVAAAASRNSVNGVPIPMGDPHSAEAFRRRSLCSFDQPGVVMTKLPQGKSLFRPSFLPIAPGLGIAACKRGT